MTDRPLTLRQMEVLRAVLDAHGISAAARAMGVSQPAVSRTVAAAEAQAGLRLFEREGAQLVPTPEMLDLAREIERVFLDVEATQGLVRALRAGAGRVIRLAVTPSLAGAFLPAAALRLRESFPAAVLSVKVREPAPIERAVLRRDFDLGLIFSTAEGYGLRAVSLPRGPVIGLLPAGHRLAEEGGPLTPARLDGEPLISFEPGSPTGAELDAAFARAGAARRLAVQTANSQAAIPMIRAGLGVGLLDPFSLDTPAVEGLAVRSFLPRVLLRPRLVFAADRRLSAPEIALVEAIRAEAEAWAPRAAQALEG